MLLFRTLPSTLTSHGRNGRRHRPQPHLHRPAPPPRVVDLEHPAAAALARAQPAVRRGSAPSCPAGEGDQLQPPAPVAQLDQAAAAAVGSERVDVRRQQRQQRPRPRQQRQLGRAAPAGSRCGAGQEARPPQAQRTVALGGSRASARGRPSAPAAGRGGACGRRARAPAPPAGRARRGTRPRARLPGGRPGSAAPGGASPASRCGGRWRRRRAGTGRAACGASCSGASWRSGRDR